MSYIGDTPWKKLKKLFMISTDLIKHYGIRYFIYVMRAQYEKKGLSMFTLSGSSISFKGFTKQNPFGAFHSPFLLNRKKNM